MDPDKTPQCASVEPGESTTLGTTTDSPKPLRAATTWTATSPPLEVSRELIDTLVNVGGYSHPLFNPTPEKLANGVFAPLMGQGVLLLAGGLAERSGAMDDVIALLEFREVRFHAMITAGDRIHVVMTCLATRVTSGGKRVSDYAWAVVDQTGQTVLDAVVVMLRRAEGGD